MEVEEEKTKKNYQKEAKEIVKKELEKQGVINYMRAKLKKSVIDIIDHQKENVKQNLEFDFMTPLHRLNKPKEIILVCQLIKEFLKFYELEYTLPIFENESNVKETVKRETLLKEFKLQELKEKNKPVILMLLDKLKNNTNNINEDNNLNRYDNNNYNKPFANINEDINKLNNQLNPNQYGSTNKSLDMSNQNKNENQIKNNNLIDDENINKQNPELIDNNVIKNENNQGINENKDISGEKKEENMGVIKISPIESNKTKSKYNDKYQEAINDVTGKK